MRSRSAQAQARVMTRPNSDEGATTVEYGLMVGLIALVAVGAVMVFGEAVRALFQSAVDSWP